MSASHGYVYIGSFDGSRGSPPNLGRMDSFVDSVSQPEAGSSGNPVVESPADTAKAYRLTPVAQNRTVESDFVVLHLNNGEIKGTRLPSLDLSNDQNISDLIASIQTTGVGEVPLYSVHCALLNSISEQVFQQLQDNELLSPSAPRIVFIDHHGHSPPAHPYTSAEKPDIFAIYSFPELSKYLVKDSQSQYHGIPYYRMISVIENKTEYTFNEGRPQVTSYMLQHLEARPDMPGLYAITANPNFYQVLWGDASGTYASAEFQWSSLDPLVAYIRSLYSPPAEHHLFDPSVHTPALIPHRRIRKPGKKSITWTIDHDGQSYPNCESIFTGPICGRRTTVFARRDEHGEFLSTIIKDYYRDDQRRFDEVKLINHIHVDGTVPGVVRLLVTDPEKSDVKSSDGVSITTARPASKTVRHRTKKRIVMGSHGKKLSQAQSVKDLLMAIYDIVEVHRTLVNQRRVLHRDISFHNVLMYPRHCKDVDGDDRPLMKNPPKFIDEVLGIPNESKDKSRGLLIDLDNGAALSDIEQKAVDVAELANRTGTPRYIARAVRMGRLLGRSRLNVFFDPMPTLSGEALERYVKVYSQASYDQYEDAEGTTHGGKPISLDAERPKFCHRPDHDAESIFWTLLVALILAYPADSVYVAPTKEFRAVWESIERHTISHDQDSRNSTLNYSNEEFADVLHPRLASLAPLLSRLSSQVSPEYAYLSPAPPEDHLHEAFRRILLEHIVSMKDPIPLKPGWSRVGSSKRPEGIIGLPPGGNKRTADMTPEDLRKEELRFAKKMRREGHVSESYVSYVTTDEPN
ncbi:hypothetical protein K474DRAFT_1659020 [Panus rudis PR-1116 ss-1]|nr:hypothetical protein K474DRAFT_1659020 [Panus rudis PR-1116 ss-1]